MNNNQFKMQNQPVRVGNHECHHERCHQIYIQLEDYFSTAVNFLTVSSELITEALETFSICFSQYCYQDNLYHLLNGPPFKRYGIKVYSALEEEQRRRETFQLVQDHIQGIVNKRSNQRQFRERNLLARNAAKLQRNNEIVQLQERLKSRRQRAKEAKNNILKFEEEAVRLEGVKARLKQRISTHKR